MIGRGEGWELRLGDCLDPETGLASLAMFPADHMITDPPYSERTHAGVRSSKRREYDRGKHGADTRRAVELGFEHLTDEVRSACAVYFAQARRWCLVFCDLEGQSAWQRELEASGLRHWRFGVWRKVGAAPQFNGCGPAQAAEAIEVAHSTATMRWNGGGRHAFWEHPIVLERGNGETRVHTTQKPLALMESLVRDFTDPDELICDPFAGSGTTGVAAIRLRRRFIGWERKPDNFASAVKRLRVARPQIELFDASNPGRQEPMF